MKKIGFKILAIVVIIVSYVGSFLIGRSAGLIANKLWYKGTK